MTQTNSQEAGVRRFFDKLNGHHAYLEKRFGVTVRAVTVQKLLGAVTGSAILDVGCGDGTLSLQYAVESNRLTLIDLSNKMLEAAKQNAPTSQRSNIEYLNLDFLEYVSDQRFDIVLCIGVLAHVQSLDVVANKIYGLLKAGGRCLIQYTDNRSLIARIDSLYFSLFSTVFGNPYAYPIQTMSYPDALRCFLRSGFKVLDQYRYSFLLPGMGRFPDWFLYKYQLFTLESRFLSRLGSEVIILLQKE